MNGVWKGFIELETHAIEIYAICNKMQKNLFVAIKNH